MIGELTRTPSRVLDKVKDAVVVVKTLDADGQAMRQGSGVLISSGRIATNYHVIEGGTFSQVGQGRKLVSATLYAEDSDKDICLLDAKGIEGRPAQLGKAKSLWLGERVYAVGAPEGMELSISDGIVAQLRGGPPPLIETTAAISPGLSGGGLFEGEGRLVGLSTRYVECSHPINFALPVEWISEIKPGRKGTTGGPGHIEWLERSVALEELKDWQGLLDWCRKWIEREPEEADAWNSLGASYASLKRYKDAIEPYRKALKINPRSGDSWHDLAITYGKLNCHNDAIEAYRGAIDAYRQALRINPKLGDACYGLGSLYDELHCHNDAIEGYRDAVEAYRQVLTMNPELGGAWCNLGAAYSKLNRHDDAIGAYIQALRINSENVTAWYGLGFSYVLSGNRTGAMEAVQRLRCLDPARADELFNDWIVPR